MSGKLSALGYPIDQSKTRFGSLLESSSLVSDPSALKKRFDDEGYIYIKSFFPASQISAIRKGISTRLKQRGYLDQTKDAELLKAAPNNGIYRVMTDFNDIPEVKEVAEGQKMLDIHSILFGEEAIALNHICPRVVGPGRAEPPHCDVVYMGRGSKRVNTTWVPISPVPQKRGGLMLLEQSHNNHDLRGDYCSMDVDNLGVFDGLRLKHGRLVHGGRYTRRPDRAVKELGGRWLTADYTPGDLVIFNCYLLHGTLDNQTENFRVSLDSRYQPKNDPMDDRWVGEKPLAHTARDWNVFTAMDKVGKRVRDAARSAKVRAH